METKLSPGISETSDISAVVPGEVTHKIKQYPSISLEQSQVIWEMHSEKKKESKMGKSSFTHTHKMIWPAINVVFVETLEPKDNA